MNDSVLGRLTSRRLDEDTSGEEEVDALDDLGAFGWLRGVRDRAIMLELRKKDGSVVAFGYSWLERAEFNPSEGINLHFGGKSVRIIGRNLAGEARPNVRLLAGILRHRVPWIQEADEPSLLEAAKEATVIESVQIK